ncbi:unnamed protein product [Parajaminaea phylloscopi]
MHAHDLADAVQGQLNDSDDDDLFASSDIERDERAPDHAADAHTLSLGPQPTVSSPLVVDAPTRIVYGSASSTRAIRAPATYLPNGTSASSSPNLGLVLPSGSTARELPHPADSAATQSTPAISRHVRDEAAHIGGSVVTAHTTPLLDGASAIDRPSFASSVEVVSPESANESPTAACEKPVRAQSTSSEKSNDSGNGTKKRPSGAFYRKARLEREQRQKEYQAKLDRGELVTPADLPPPIRLRKQSEKVAARAVEKRRLQEALPKAVPSPRPKKRKPAVKPREKERQENRPIWNVDADLVRSFSPTAALVSPPSSSVGTSSLPAASHARSDRIEACDPQQDSTEVPETPFALARGTASLPSSDTSLIAADCPTSMPDGVSSPSGGVEAAPIPAEEDSLHDQADEDEILRLIEQAMEDQQQDDDRLCNFDEQEPERGVSATAAADAQVGSWLNCEPDSTDPAPTTNKPGVAGPSHQTDGQRLAALHPTASIADRQDLISALPASEAAIEPGTGVASQPDRGQVSSPRNLPTSSEDVPPSQANGAEQPPGSAAGESDGSSAQPVTMGQAAPRPTRGRPRKHPVTTPSAPSIPAGSLPARTSEAAQSGPSADTARGVSGHQEVHPSGYTQAARIALMRRRARLEADLRQHKTWLEEARQEAGLLAAAKGVVDERVLQLERKRRYRLLQEKGLLLNPGNGGGGPSLTSSAGAT